VGAAVREDRGRDFERGKSSEKSLVEIENILRGVTVEMLPFAEYMTIMSEVTAASEVELLAEEVT
jgi:hypothetical protein